MNPKINHRPPGKAYWNVLVGVAIVAIILAAILTPFGEKKEPLLLSMLPVKKLTRDELLASIAVDRDAPRVLIRGRVLMPDGSPAKNIPVNVHAFEVLKEKSGNFSFSFGCGLSPYLPQTDDDGYFQFETLPGVNLIVGVYRDRYNNDLVSDPMVLASKAEDNEEILVQLYEGTSVRFSMKYENGHPVANRKVFCSRPFEPMIGKDIDSVKRNFNLQFRPQLDSNGEVVMSFPAGEYQFQAEDSFQWLPAEEKTVLVEKGKPTSVDLTLATPIFVTLQDENGTPLDNLPYFHACTAKPSRNDSNFISLEAFLNDNEQKTDEHGNTLIFPSEKDNYLIAVTPDGRLGTVEKLLPKDAGQSIIVTLRPNVQVTAKLVEGSTGNPIAEKDVSVLINAQHVEKRGANHPFALASRSLYGKQSFRTDKNGSITLYLPGMNEEDKELLHFELQPGKTGEFYGNTMWGSDANMLLNKKNIIQPDKATPTLDLGSMEF